MTEASPVTHVGYIAPPEMNRPASIGQPLALTECRIVDVTDRGRSPRANPANSSCAARRSCWDTGRSRRPPPPFFAMAGTSPATSSRSDADGFYYVLDRSKEMIKYKGFPVAPGRSRIAAARTSRRPRLRRGRQTRPRRGRNSLRLCRPPRRLYAIGRTGERTSRLRRRPPRPPQAASRNSLCGRRTADRIGQNSRAANCARFSPEQTRFVGTGADPVSTAEEVAV